MRIRFCVILLIVFVTCSFFQPALAFEAFATGSKGAAVAELQTRLNALGYEAGTADGSFGNRTREAVIHFQEANDLEATGVVDEATHELLFSPSAKPSGAGEAARDPEVTRLQRMLGLLGYGIDACSGLYDADTLAALSRFQADNGLDADTFDLNPVFARMEALLAAKTGDLLLMNNGDPENLLYGYMDTAGQVVIPAQFTYASGTWGDGLAAVTRADGTNGYIDASGDTVLETGDAAGETFSEGIALIASGEQRGYIDMSGELVFALDNGKADKYMCTAFASGRARVGDKLIDRYGQTTALPLSFQDVSSMMFSAFSEDFHEGLMCLRKVTDEGRKYGYIDVSGQTAIPFRYDDADSFSEGLARTGVADPNSEIRYGYIDVSGKTVIQPAYIAAGTFREGMAPVRDAEKGWGLVDKDGNFTEAEVQWDGLLGDGFHDGLLAVVKDGQVGFVDISGKLAIPFRFTDPTTCTSSAERPLTSDRFYAFRGGVCLVIGEKQELFYIDKNGEALFPAGIY